MIQQRAYLGRREIVKIVYVLSWAVIVKVFHAGESVINSEESCQLLRCARTHVQWIAHEILSD